MNRSLIVCLALCVTPLANAHGDVHERIDALDRQIAQAPKDAALLIKRGHLYLDAGHAKDARRDFIRAKALSPSDIDLSYYLAEAELALYHLDAAEAASRKFIESAQFKAARSRGLTLQGDIRMAAKHPLEAADSYLAAIEFSDDVRPEHYVKAAEAYLSAGKTDTSLQTLNTGLDRLGPLSALNERALTIEIHTKRYDAALGRVEKMLASSPQIPHLLYRKGLIHKAMGQTGPSRQAFEAALAELKRLPPERQNTPAFQSLKAALMAEVEAAG